MTFKRISVVHNFRWKINNKKCRLKKNTRIRLTELFKCLVMPENASVAPLVALINSFMPGIAPGKMNVNFICSYTSNTGQQTRTKQIPQFAHIQYDKGNNNNNEIK